MDSLMLAQMSRKPSSHEKFPPRTAANSALTGGVRRHKDGASSMAVSQAGATATASPRSSRPAATSASTGSAAPTTRASPSSRSPARLPSRPSPVASDKTTPSTSRPAARRAFRPGPPRPRLLLPKDEFGTRESLSREEIERLGRVALYIMRIEFCCTYWRLK